MVREIHTILGIDFDEEKVQVGRVLKILGVKFDLDKMEIDIDPARRVELIEEIVGILESGELMPGQAAKLKGKLMFAEGQLFGRCGRSLLRSLSLRQYQDLEKDPNLGLNAGLTRSLRGWLMILNGYGQPRKIREEGSDAVDMVVYTDGWFPEKGDWSVSYTHLTLPTKA